MSVATEHPRTPWSVKPAFHVPGFHIMTPSIGGRTFRLFSSDHATADEARLAAAAPELLEAAKKLDKHWLDAGWAPPDPDPSQEGLSALSPETLDIWRTIRAAIAKAQGDAQ